MLFRDLFGLGLLWLVLADDRHARNGIFDLAPQTAAILFDGAVSQVRIHLPVEVALIHCTESKRYQYKYYSSQRVKKWDQRDLNPRLPVSSVISPKASALRFWSRLFYQAKLWSRAVAAW